MVLASAQARKWQSARRFAQEAMTVGAGTRDQGLGSRVQGSGFSDQWPVNWVVLVLANP